MKVINYREMAHGYVERFGANEDATIPLLQAIQKDQGYLPIELLEAICEVSRFQRNQLYGIATFYSQFRLTPKGKHVIKVCKGTACHVRNADMLLETIRLELGISLNETTPDKRFSLETVACLGCCSLAPAMMIDDKVYGRLTPHEVKDILKNYVE